MDTQYGNSSLGALLAKNGDARYTRQAPPETNAGGDTDAAARPPKAARRRYSAEFKRRILRLADACTERGQIGEILRREGLYYSTLNLFQQQRQQGLLDDARKARPGQSEKATLKAENERLQRENARLQKKLSQADILLDLQKKVCQLLEIPLWEPATAENEPSD